MSPAASLVFRLVQTSAGLSLLCKLWACRDSLHFMFSLHPYSTSAPDPAVSISSVCNSQLGRRWCLACHHLLAHFLPLPLPPEAPVPDPTPALLASLHLHFKDDSLWFRGTSQGCHISRGLGPPRHHKLTLGTPSHGHLVIQGSLLAMCGQSAACLEPRPFPQGSFYHHRVCSQALQAAFTSSPGERELTFQ